MPKDYIQISLGLQEFSVLGWKENELEIVVEVIRRSSYAVCPRCGESTNKVHQYQKRLIEDIPMQKRLWLQIKQRRVKCFACGKVFTETFNTVRPGAHRTVRFERYLYEHGKNRALKDVALENQVNYTTYRRLWYRCAKEEIDNRSCEYPRIMGVDEFSVAKRHKYRTVVTDLERHKVVMTLAGRDKDGLKNYLKTFPDDSCPEIFVVDIWKGYINAIREVCSGAVIVADKFHIIRMVNHTLDLTRRVIQRKAKQNKREPIYRAKPLLLKAHERLTEEEHERLLALFKLAPVLGDAYELKELLRQIYKVKDYDEACGLFKWWCGYAFYSGLPGFKDVAKTFFRWFDIITNYFRYRVTNAFTEGMNNRIKLDERMAYGYRNFSNQHLRILALSA